MYHINPLDASMEASELGVDGDFCIGTVRTPETFYVFFADMVTGLHSSSLLLPVPPVPTMT